jgi:uncharacterized membrane protein YoaK (UPF0700 family)
MPETTPEPRITASASAVLLCFGAGATDVLSYLTLGKIFTSAMTGCAALLFVKATGGDFPTAMRAALALASYVVGCGLAVALQPADTAQAKSPFTLRRLLLLECILLGCYCIMATHGPARPTGALLLCLIFISATAMGVQSIVAQDLSEPGISTVVLNPTMTSLSTACMNVLRGREPKLPRPNRLQAFVLVAYAFGALLAAFGIPMDSHAVAYLPLVAALSVLALTQVDCALDAKAKNKDGAFQAHSSGG